MKKLAATMAVLLLAGCEPDATTPGLWLSGTSQPFPADWSFTQPHREIAIEVTTPYLVPHSVTIWCADLDGDLYVGAAAPETKNWPAWVMEDPDVVLKIGDDIYEATLNRLEDPELIGRVGRVYQAKYDLGPRGEDYIGWYWSVAPRSGS